MEYLQCREMSCVERYRGWTIVGGGVEERRGGEISRSLEDALSVTCAGALTGSHVAIDTGQLSSLPIQHPHLDAPTGREVHSPVP